MPFPCGRLGLNLFSGVQARYSNPSKPPIAD